MWNSKHGHDRWIALRGAMPPAAPAARVPPLALGRRRRIGWTRTGASMGLPVRHLKVRRDQATDAPDRCRPPDAAGTCLPALEPLTLRESYQATPDSIPRRVMMSDVWLRRRSVARIARRRFPCRLRGGDELGRARISRQAWRGGTNGTDRSRDAARSSDRPRLRLLHSTR